MSKKFLLGIIVLYSYQIYSSAQMPRQLDTPPIAPFSKVNDRSPVENTSFSVALTAISPHASSNRSAVATSIPSRVSMTSSLFTELHDAENQTDSPSIQKQDFQVQTFLPNEKSFFDADDDEKDGRPNTPVNFFVQNHVVQNPTDSASLPELVKNFKEKYSELLSGIDDERVTTAATELFKVYSDLPNKRLGQLIYICNNPSRLTQETKDVLKLIATANRIQNLRQIFLGRN